MKAEKLSVNRVCIAIGAFLLLLSVSMSLFLYFLTKNTLVLCCGLLYAAGAFGCLTLFLAFIRRKLTLFSDALCKQLDDMMSSDREPPQYAVEENLFYKIQHRLSRLYEVLREGKSRKHEFATLESIGMTKKQIRNVLLWEGGYYWSISFLLLATLGTAIYIPIYSVFRKMVPYAAFSYPVIPLLSVAAIVLLVCFVTPVITFKQGVKESVVERLRQN